MMQTKKQSLIESLTNTFAGTGLSYAVSFVVYPLLGMTGNPTTYAAATAIFTLLSITRNYIIRRLFVCFRKRRQV